jgi:hypothetical protein
MALVCSVITKPLDLDYSDSWTAQKKMAEIWSRIEKTKDTTTWWWFPFKLMWLPLDDMNLSFEKSDFI